jgi:predicted nucleic acid-binding protein
MAQKKIVLCDTNIIIELFKNEKHIINEIKIIGEKSLYISSITAAELFYGAINKTELRKIKKRLNKIVHIPINEDINEIFENLMFEYSLSNKISIPDAIIAATAIYYEIPLFTLNKKDFKFIDGIKLYEF